MFGGIICLTIISLKLLCLNSSYMHILCYIVVWFTVHFCLLTLGVVGAF